MLNLSVIQQNLCLLSAAFKTVLKFVARIFGLCLLRAETHKGYCVA